jgi:uncharacterized delta-60 repeat protein
MLLKQTQIIKISPLKRLIFPVIALLFFAISLQAQVNTGVDSTFNPTVTKDVTTNYSGNFNIQPDGKIIIWGTFRGSNFEFLGNYFKRLNADGTEDTTFNCTVCRLYTAALAQADGKILLGGTNGSTAYIVRVNSDGSQDFSYTSPFLPPTGGSVTSATPVAIQSDGKAIVREFSSFQAFHEERYHRLNTDGTFDSSFTPISLGAGRNYSYASRVLILSDGKILIGGSSALVPATAFLVRYNSNGTRDNTFESPSFANSFNSTRTAVYDFDVQTDGEIVIGGNFTSVNSINRQNIVRLMPAGNVDTSFTPANVFTGDGAADKVRVLSNGQILINAGSSNVPPAPTIPPRLFRFNSDGSLDNTYTPPAGLSNIYQLELYDSSRVFLFGNFNGIPKYARLNFDGSLDTAFTHPNLARVGSVTTLATQTDGKILIGGDFDRVNGAVKNTLARVNSDGSLDASFDAGSAGVNLVPKTIVLQADGKILVGGVYLTDTGTTPRLIRLNANGSIDSTFNAVLDGGVYSIALLPNGQIIIGGSFTTAGGAAQVGAARLNSDGSRDASFNPMFPSAIIQAVLVQSDGKILLGGSFSAINGFNRQNLVRVNSDASVDTSFNAGSISTVYQLTQQLDGKILVLNFSSIVKRNTDGTADGSFQPPTVSSDGQIKTMFRQADGNIVIGGLFSAVNGQPRNNFARLSASGSLDPLFFTNAGTDAEVNTIIGQADGKIIVGGRFSSIGNVPRLGIARITTAPFRRKTNFDFDGDGLADVSVFRPSENKWFVLRSSDSGITQQIFALNGDHPVPADYDGDGKTDFAIFRPSLGDWWYLSSINNAQINQHWGSSTDVTRPSDFDGDGRADYVLFRPSTVFWYRLNSANTFTSNSEFGYTTDKAVTGDFDGDGKSDRAIYRPSTGDWWWQSSVDNVQRATHWGISTDVPTPADYDGDGRTDFAVYRPSTGVWYIYNSSNAGSTIINFGISEDKPVAADYDGDGRADIAVFRPSTGVWYLLRSTQGFTALQFGVSTDIPTQYSFVP